MTIDRTDDSLLGGRVALWQPRAGYRVSIDADDGLRDHADDEEGGLGADVSPTGDTPPNRDVSPTGDTRVIPEATGVSPTKDTYNDLSIVIDHTHTPTPPPEPDVCVKAKGVLDELRADGTNGDVVDAYIAPLIGVLRWPAGIEDRLALLRAIRDALAGTPPAVLARAAVLTRNRRTTWPSAAQAGQIAEHAAPEVPQLRIAGGTPAFTAWLAHYRRTGRGWWADQCESRGFALEHSEYPLVVKGRAA